MKYDYTTTLATNTKGKVTKRPSGPSSNLSSSGRKRISTPSALIDSGADTTLMNMEYAKELGIDFSKAQKKEFLGIGNSRVTSYITPVTMKVKHFDVAITTPVAFTDSPAVDILLGQEDFFESFRIKFEKDHDTFDLSLSPKLKDR